VNLKGKYHLGDLGIDGRKIFKGAVRKCLNILIAFMWLRIDFNFWTL
jgi:hypothetical protein